MATSESRLDLASPLSPADTSRAMLENFERDCLRSDRNLFDEVTGNPAGVTYTAEQRDAARAFLMQQFHAAGMTGTPTNTNRDAYSAPRAPRNAFSSSADWDDADLLNYAME